MHLIKEIGLWNKTCKISLHIMEGKEFAYCTSEYLQGLEHSHPPALKNSPQPFAKPRKIFSECFFCQSTHSLLILAD